MVVIAFGLTAGRGPDSTKSAGAASSAAAAPVSVAPVPSDAATVEPCAQVIDALPVTFDGLAPRIVQTPQAVAWGNPAVVLRCGVGRPSVLVAGSTAQLFAVNDVFWYVDQGKSDVVFTAVDRSVYIELTAPAGSPVTLSDLSPISTAIASVLPAVCYVQTPIADQPSLPACTRR